MRLSQPRFTLKRTVEPVPLALSLDDARTQARIDDDTYNATLIRYIKAATRLAENTLRRAFITQTWRLGLDNWPNYDGDYGWGDSPSGDSRDYIRFNRYRELELPRPPLQTVSSIIYTDPTGAPQTLSPANYIVYPDAEPGKVAPQLAFAWPPVKMVPFPIVITFVAGYGAAQSNIPENIQQWIALAVSAQNENRESDIQTALKQFGLGYELLMTESLGDLVY